MIRPTQAITAGVRIAAIGSVLLIAALTATFALAASVALATDASPEPSVSSIEASPVAEIVKGWPAAEHDPAGLYSWTAGRGWMHKVPQSWSDDAPNSVELTFYVATLPDLPTMGSHAVWRAWWEDGPFDHPARVGNEVRTEMWLLDIDEGRRVAILLDSFPDTDPALVAEARAVIESIVAEPTESGHRLVFRLLEGWDSG